MASSPPRAGARRPSGSSSISSNGARHGQADLRGERDLSVGGPHLAAAMIAANLVDELHAFVHPIIVGGGNPWLPQDLRIPLELADERRLGGVVHLHHRRGS
ncbi:MAG TPA: dihydrofolate reductase family protein [Kofleriaceae bacterium]|nr:dihydrofolate reductase family protein [Kofleriaceae bacterium]